MPTKMRSYFVRDVSVKVFIIYCSLLFHQIHLYSPLSDSMTIRTYQQLSLYSHKTVAKSVTVVIIKRNAFGLVCSRLLRITVCH